MRAVLGVMLALQVTQVILALQVIRVMLARVVLGVTGVLALQVIQVILVLQEIKVTLALQAQVVLEGLVQTQVTLIVAVVCLAALLTMGPFLILVECRVEPEAVALALVMGDLEVLGVLGGLVGLGQLLLLALAILT